MKKIAMCINTKDRPDMVARVLRTAAKQYAKYPLDIYYYDASVTDETQKIVEKYQLEYKNIHYFRFPPEQESNVKRLAWIYTGANMEDSYDYMWLVKDRQRFLESSLNAVFAAAEAGADVIFLGTIMRNPDLFNPTESYDATPTEFYRDWGWRAGTQEASIISFPTMIGRDLSEEEVVHVYKSHEYNCDWFAFSWMFHKLAELQEGTVRILVGKDAASVGYNHGKSEWNRRVFKVFKDNWIRVNEELPEIFDAYKNKVIFEGACRSEILGSVNIIKELYDTGILTKDNLESALLDWERVSDIPARVVRDIVYDLDESHDVSIMLGRRGDIADFLIKVIEMLRMGKISAEQVPFCQIEECIRKELTLQYNVPVEEKVLLDGVLKDMNYYIQSGEMDAGHMQSLLQCLLVLASLLAGY